MTGKTVAFYINLVACSVCIFFMAGYANAQPAALPPGARVSTSSSRPQPGQPPTTPSSQPATPSANDKDKKEGEQAKKDEPTQPKIILRTDYKPDPLAEPFPVEPGADGKIRFNFHGTPWPVVLDWLTRFSHINLDWQELPGDYLNLRTQKTYSADEARDIVNRHLLARGYTILQHGEVLSVAKIATLNPGLVPRVTPEDLAQRMPHEYVKVSLPLDWILADEAVEQLKPMLSPNGKLNAITAVNRLEAMDVAINLQEVFHLLTDEQSGSDADKGLVREFKLDFVRAADVIDSLYGILGLRKPQTASGGSSSMSSSMSMQIMQQLQRMQQQQQQRGSSAGGGKAETEPKLVLNERENSILAHASPDKMEIIEETIKAMDVPSKRTSHLLQNLDRMKVYRLSTLKPEPLVKILTEIGDLSPATKIQIDSDNNSLIVYGELADHVTVQSLVERLDGSSRSFEVIPLRRLRAIDVAGTIQYMLGEEEKEDDNNRSRYYYYSSYRSEPESKKDDRPFRVDADLENNRLLVWANEVELEEIQNLLIKMGEFPSGQTNPARTRVIDLYSDKEAQQMIQQLQQNWKNLHPNQLKIETPEKKPEADPAADSPPKEERTEVRQPAKAQFEFVSDKSETLATESNELVQILENPTQPATSNDRNSDTPPVTIRQLPDGKIFLESDDPAALDEMEFMISELKPPSPDYKIFHIKYAWPFGIEMLLDDFFESKDGEENTLDWWGNPLTYNKETPDRLSKQRQLNIISDDDSRTLLVQGGTAQQLAMIEELINIFDQPSSSDPQAIRQTRVFHLKYSQAAPIGETIKAVYRDLLSSNDPALQNKNKEGQQQSNQGITFAPYARNNEKDDDAEQPQEPIKFKGLLSIGVDEISNTLVVSAATGLMENIVELVEILDLAAMPSTTVQVVPVHPQISASFLRDRLTNSFGLKMNVSSTASRQAGNQDGNNAPQQPPQQNNGQPANNQPRPNN